MDASQLSELIDELRLVGTDGQSLEVKSAVGKSVLGTLSAFANTSGGILIVGLSEKEGMQPVPDFDAQRQLSALESRLRQLTPIVRAKMSILPFESTNLLVAEIDELLPRDKPCYVTEHGTYHGSYYRVGSGDHLLQTYEVDRLIEEHSQPTWDNDAVDGATLADLNSDALSSYLDSQRSSRPRTFAHGDSVAMQRLHIIRDTAPTLAALLTLGEYPQEFFPRLTVTFARFPGSSKGDVVQGLRLLDSRTFTGPIPELVEEVVGHVQRNMSHAALIEGAYRRDLPEYPVAAVREAITNALMHRDYSPIARGSQVQVNMFVDRLEITNPGGLYGTVTTRTLGRAGLSSSRNQHLSTLLEHVSLPGGGSVAENRGTGIAVIEEALHQALMPRPIFRDDLTSFTVIFRRRRIAPEEKRLTARQWVLSLLDERESVSTTELVEATGLSRTSILNAVKALMDAGNLEALEPPRSPRQRYRRNRT